MALSKSSSKNSPLYEASGKTLFYNDFAASLKKAGVKNGDVIFVHSDIGSFGKLLTADRQLLLGSLLRSMKEAVGPSGTIVMPTFSYSFEKDGIFDVENTKSTVGTLTEFFRKQKNVGRTSHPNHSIAVWGRMEKEFLDADNDTFGTNSVFARLHNIKGKIVFLGASFQSCTFIHYIEQMHHVPYRIFVKMKGKVIVRGKTKSYEVIFYKKYSYFFTSLSKLEDHLLGKGMMKKVQIGNSNILAIDSTVLYDEGYGMLDKDIRYFLRNDGIFRLFNMLALPVTRYAQPIARMGDKIFSRILEK